MRPTITPTIKQHEAWQALMDDKIIDVYFGGGAGGGKSWLGCEWKIVEAYQYPGVKSFIARNELKRLMSSTFITFGKVCKHHKIPIDDWALNSKYNFIEFKNGSRIDLLDVSYLPSDPMYERFGSTEYTTGWYEEAAEMAFMAIEVLGSRTGRHLNKELKLLPKKLYTFNPNKKWIYKIYKMWKEKKLPEDMKFIQSLFRDNPYTADEYGKQLARLQDKAMKERLMFGNFEYDDDPSTLINYDAILDLFTNSVEEDDNKYMIVDAARFGGDRIVIDLWNGLHSYKTYISRKRSLETTRQEIVRIAQDEHIPYSHILIDEDGVGGGLVDGLPGVKGFVANSSPIDEDNTEILKPNFRNLKAQCGYKLADYINNHMMAVTIDVVSIEPDSTPEQVKQQLIQELEWIKRKDMDNDEKKLQLLPKEEIKEHIGRSPDLSDTKMMRMFFELKPVEMFETSQYTPSWITKRR